MLLMFIHCENLSLFNSTGHDDEPAVENPDEIEAYDNEEDPSEFITMSIPIPINSSNSSSFRSEKVSDPPSDM